ncbi:MAG: hypothetical protein IKO78_02545 [Bacilli bacterium]|nr:hypothetical protein [Bacilli bacterium]
MKDELLQIINHYGIEHQQRKLEEEVFELQQAITKFENTDFGKWEDKKYIFTKDIIEELADVEVLLNQIQNYYQIDGQKIIDVMQFKVDRQLGRIENEIHS